MPADYDIDHPLVQAAIARYRRKYGPDSLDLDDPAVHDRIGKWRRQARGSQYAGADVYGCWVPGADLPLDEHDVAELGGLLPQCGDDGYTDDSVVQPSAGRGRRRYGPRPVAPSPGTRSWQRHTIPNVFVIEGRASLEGSR